MFVDRELHDAREVHVGQVDGRCRQAILMPRRDRSLHRRTGDLCDLVVAEGREDRAVQASPDRFKARGTLVDLLGQPPVRESGHSEPRQCR